MYDVEFEDDVAVNTGLSKLLAKTLSGDLSIQQLFVNKATLIENHLPAECWIIRTDQRLNRPNWDSNLTLAKALLQFEFPPRPWFGARA